MPRTTSQPHLQLGAGAQGEGVRCIRVGFILGEAYKVLVVGVDVGQLNVNQQHHLE